MSKHSYGPNGHIVDAFIKRLRGMTEDDWWAVATEWSDSIRFCLERPPWFAAQDGASDDAENVAIAAAGKANWYAGVMTAARYYRWEAARNAVRYATRDAVREIQGADLLRERGQPFFFLPMFGFADERAVIESNREEHLK